MEKTKLGRTMLEPLEESEFKVLNLLKDGISSRQEIADSLEMSYLKVEVCVRRVIKYFDASCVTDAVIKAIGRGYIELGKGE